MWAFQVTGSCVMMLKSQDPSQQSEAALESLNNSFLPKYKGAGFWQTVFRLREEQQTDEEASETTATHPRGRTGSSGCWEKSKLETKSQEALLRRASEEVPGVDWLSDVRLGKQKHLQGRSQSSGSAQLDASGCSARQPAPLHNSGNKTAKSKT